MNRVLWLSPAFNPAMTAEQRALQALVVRGLVDTYDLVAVPSHDLSPERAEETWRQVVEAAERCEPTIVVWQHVGRFPVRARQLDALLNLGEQPLLAYQDGDAWGWVRKRITPSMRVLLSRASVAAFPGTGSLARRARLAGAREVIHLPNGYDTTRFGTRPVPPTREFDVVMVGNLLRARRPGGGVPGTRRRLALASALQRRLGSRFAIFGRGWEGFSSWNGPIGHQDQEKANQRGMVSVGHNHFHRLPGYYSDRLPIALASGVPHVSNHQPGLPEQLAAIEGLFLENGPAGVVGRVTELLARSPAELDELGAAARRAVASTLSKEALYARLLTSLVERRSSTLAVRGER